MFGSLARADDHERSANAFVLSAGLSESNGRMIGYLPLLQKSLSPMPGGAGRIDNASVWYYAFRHVEA
jgi:hypothetical protein